MKINDNYIISVYLFRLDVPLIKPYKLSYNTFHSFEPIIIRMIDNNGKEGWGEQHISPGSSNETRDGGWTFARILAKLIIKKPLNEAKQIISSLSHFSKVAASAMITSIEMMESNKILENKGTVKLKLLTAFNAEKEFEIKDELDQLIDNGFNTIKVKVGKDVKADLKKINRIQTHLNGRATLRIDANRGYTKIDGCNFVRELEPNYIELFEQPCHSEDWEANAAVAKISKVPIMLDEPICDLKDIKRASQIPGVGLCKLKLKRFTSIQNLYDSIKYAHSLGLKIVLGDGLGSEINCWMEAKIANDLIDNAGEYNGFLKVKPEARILKTPLKFEKGFLIIEENWIPEIDKDKLKKYTIFNEVIENTI